MSAKILQFRRRREMKHKIDPERLALMMKHHRLIANYRSRGFTDLAIAKVIAAKEASKR